jgi:hypothetical protein
MGASSSGKSESGAVAAPAGGRVGLLAGSGELPAFRGDGAAIPDPSPLAALNPRQRARRLCGLLELFASYGDAGAAAEALRHYRWEREMRDGKPPQRVDVAGSVGVLVLDSLSAPPGTPIPAPKRIPAGRSGESDAPGQGT